MSKKAKTTTTTKKQLIIEDDTKVYNAVSLFSGLGGDALGMTQAGCKVIAYNELNLNFCKSHDANLKDCELICDGKITDISKLKDECFTKFKGKTSLHTQESQEGKRRKKKEKERKRREDKEATIREESRGEERGR